MLPHFLCNLILGMCIKYIMFRFDLQYADGNIQNYFTGYLPIRMLSGKTAGGIFRMPPAQFAKNCVIVRPWRSTQ